MKILIVDDEIDAREALHILLKNYCPDDNEYYFASDVKEAVKKISTEQPQIVFLDVEMPVHRGFELFNFITNPTFATIFVTAYDQYAIKAFEVSALDYILKPVEPSHLIRAYNKAKEELEAVSLRERLEVLKNQITGSMANSKIVIPVAFGYEFVEASNIICVKADGAYSEIIMEGGANIVLSKRLNQLEEILPKDSFYRLNRSYVVNVNKIQLISKKEGGLVALSNGMEMPIQKESREQLIELLGARDQDKT
jgi:two-component system LytT family response regulator